MADFAKGLQKPQGKRAQGRDAKSMRILGPQHPRFGAVSSSCVVSRHSVGLTGWWVCFWEGSRSRSRGAVGDGEEAAEQVTRFKIQALCVGSKLTSRGGVAQGQLRVLRGRSYPTPVPRHWWRCFRDGDSGQRWVRQASASVCAVSNSATCWPHCTLLPAADPGPEAHVFLVICVFPSQWLRVWLFSWRSIVDTLFQNIYKSSRGQQTSRPDHPWVNISVKEEISGLIGWRELGLTYPRGGGTLSTLGRAVSGNAFQGTCLEAVFA